ncbi:hypothetical protein [Actinomadura rugatobispora]|uniref:Uncharacterized protein n=1 Tax=Actinomadura rugatobispora TaxID=1994 RepID=A0ABW1A7H2_9ACTN|nr:hypothetical protein GCM10010200_045130 [Actinomadura rugatobispora]
MKDAKSYDSLMTAVFLIGAYEGVVPFIAKATDTKPILSLPARMPSPLWWIVSSVVIVVAFFLLWGLDSAKKRHQAR